MKANTSIMVLEDCDEDFDTLQDAARLAGLPYTIVRVITGEECMRVLQQKSQHQYTLPKLMLLDLHTPGEDGRQVLSQIRHDPTLKTLPIVILSTSDNPIDIEFCYSNGANAYHIKPVDYAMHLKALQQIFTYWLGSVSLLVSN